MPGERTDVMRTSLDVAIPLVLVGGLIYWCFLLFQPCLLLAVWGAVMAVALHPIFVRLERGLNGRRKLADAVFIVLGLAAVGLRSWWLSESFVSGIQGLTAQQRQKTLHVPAPPVKVADWPLIGERLYALWLEASETPEATLERFGPQFAHLGSRLLSSLAGVGVGILATLAATIVAGVLLMNGEG